MTRTFLVQSERSGAGTTTLGKGRRKFSFTFLVVVIRVGNKCGGKRSVHLIDFLSKVQILILTHHHHPISEPLQITMHHQPHKKGGDHDKKRHAP
jgi:hypothetical protein